MKDKEAEDYYRQRYGVDITLYGYIIRHSLENLYFKGVRLPAKTLYSKLTCCGVVLHPGALERTRMAALEKMVPAEPPLLTDFGARMWYLTQNETFNQEDVVFMARHFPQETQTVYPYLWKNYLTATKIYSSSTASARNEMAMRHSLSEAPQIR